MAGHVIHVVDDLLSDVASRLLGAQLGSAAGILHNGELKSAAVLRVLHDRVGGGVFVGVGGVSAVPVNDGALDAPALHIIQLLMDLVGVGGIVAHIHVIGLAEPHHQVG